MGNCLRHLINLGCQSGSIEVENTYFWGKNCPDVYSFVSNSLKNILWIKLILLSWMQNKESSVYLIDCVPSLIIDKNSNNWDMLGLNIFQKDVDYKKCLTWPII